MKSGSSSKSYDYLLFSKLVSEHLFADKKETEKKIKRSLKYYKLGPYNQERVDYVRQFKNELYFEISKINQSRYYRKTSSKFAQMEDFNVHQMATDFHALFNNLDKEELNNMISFAIYHAYLR